VSRTGASPQPSPSTAPSSFAVYRAVEDTNFSVVAGRLGADDRLRSALRRIFGIERGERHVIMQKRPLTETRRNFKNLRAHG
jgi:hypothetical protein